MIKEGTKYIMEVEAVYEALPDHSTVEVPKILNHLYRIKGFETLVMSCWGLSKFEKYKPMKGPYGIGCVLRIALPKPINRAEMIERQKNPPEKNKPWMITSIDKHEDGTWTYHGLQNDGEQIEVSSDTAVEYTDLFFNTVQEWATYKGEIN